MQVGINAVREIVLEGEYFADGSASPLVGPIIKTPQGGEGPFLHPHNWMEVSEVFEKSNNWPDETKNRFELSLEFIQRAIEGSDFLSYWTAFEVLCAGNAGAILSTIADCYGFENQRQAEDETGFRVLRNWRVGLVHHGKRVNLSADIERYLQLLYWDLLRHRLWLGPKGHSLSLTKTKGFDLSPIGLADNSQHAPEEDGQKESNRKLSEEEIKARSKDQERRWSELIDRWKRELNNTK